MKKVAIYGREYLKVILLVVGLMFTNKASMFGGRVYVVECDGRKRRIWQR